MTHVHWRFEEDNGQLAWKTSPDRMSWQTLGAIGTETLSFGLSTLKLNLDASSEIGSTTMTNAQFDDLNDVDTSGSVIFARYNLPP